MRIPLLSGLAAIAGLLLISPPVVAGLLLISPPAVAGDQLAGGSGIVTSGLCDREKPLVRRALEGPTQRADVDGDGRADRVTTVTDRNGTRRCRAFVVVDLRSRPTYSLPLHRTAVPARGVQAEVIGLPDLGDDPGAEIVVDTHARTDSQLSQMFTMTDHGLRRVLLGAFEDGTLVVEGGGVTYPRGAGCNRRGDLYLSMASLLDDGRYEVTRHVYRPRGDELRMPVVGTRVERIPGDRLSAVFPEFGPRHFEPCSAS